MLTARDLDDILKGAKARAAIAAVRKRDPQRVPDPRPVYKLLGERGWLTPSWPAECGGIDGSFADDALVLEKLIEYDIPDQTVNIVIGGVMRRAATKDQQRRFLRPIASGEELATIFYSEPDFGSDLAGLTTTATYRDGRWRLNGEKIWNARTPLAAHALCAARTSTGASKFSGITLFMMPVRQPGVDIREVPSGLLEPLFRVTLTDVEVQTGNVIGEVDRAWQIISNTLWLERTGLEYVARLRRWLEQTPPTGPQSPQRAAARLEVDASLALSHRIVRSADTADAQDAASAKLQATELGSVVSDVLYQEQGVRCFYSTAVTGDVSALHNACHREAPSFTVAAGTSEMMLLSIWSSLVSESRKRNRKPHTDAPQVPEPSDALSQGRICGYTLGTGEARNAMLRAAISDDAVASEQSIGFVFAGEQLSWTPACEDATSVIVDGRASGCHDYHTPTQWFLLAHTADPPIALRVLPNEAVRVACVAPGVADLTFRDASLSFGHHTYRLNAAAVARAQAWQLGYLLGLTQAALDAATDRAVRRRQFDVRLAEHQGVAFPIARLFARVAGYRALAEEIIARDRTPELIRMHPAVARLALEAARSSVHVGGAQGLTDHSAAQQIYRCALREAALFWS